MSILLLADHDGAALTDHTARALSAALEIEADVDILVAGAEVSHVASQAAQLAGAGKVLVADDPAYAHGLAETVAALVVSLADGYDTIMGAATAAGKNILPRVAALLDIAQVSEIVAVLAPDTFKRPIYAGNVIQTVRAPSGRRVITVRTSAFAAAPGGGTAPVTSVEAGVDAGLSSFVSEELVASERPELGSAKVVVSGGRALGSEENFQRLMLPLADKLGAAVGATRAAVDAGYAPNDWQVGQTGKIVAPGLYVAIGISGAIQHLAGMKDSRVIVAINKDGDAPIFQVADYGLVADLFEAVPELEKLL